MPHTVQLRFEFWRSPYKSNKLILAGVITDVDPAYHIVLQDSLNHFISCGLIDDAFQNLAGLSFGTKGGTISIYFEDESSEPHIVRVATHPDDVSEAHRVYTIEQALLKACKLANHHVPLSFLEKCIPKLPQAMTTGWDAVAARDKEAKVVVTEPADLVAAGDELGSIAVRLANTFGLT